MFRYLEIQKYVNTAEDKVIQEAKEVNSERN